MGCGSKHNDPFSLCEGIATDEMKPLMIDESVEFELIQDTLSLGIYNNHLDQLELKGWGVQVFSTNNLRSAIKKYNSYIPCNLGRLYLRVKLVDEKRYFTITINQYIEKQEAFDYRRSLITQELEEYSNHIFCVLYGEVSLLDLLLSE